MRAWFRCATSNESSAGGVPAPPGARELRQAAPPAGGCPGEYPLGEVRYRCPRCHGLLEVAHDMAALKLRSAEEWRRLFDERYKRTIWPYGSSVWGKKEWVCPEVRDDQIVSMDEGGTNLFWAD